MSRLAAKSGCGVEGQWEQTAPSSAAVAREVGAADASIGASNRDASIQCDTLMVGRWEQQLVPGKLRAGGSAAGSGGCGSSAASGPQLARDSAPFAAPRHGSRRAQEQRRGLGTQRVTARAQAASVHGRLHKQAQW